MIYIYFILKIYRLVKNIIFVSTFEVFPLIELCQWVLLCFILYYFSLFIHNNIVHINCHVWNIFISIN